MTVHIVYSCGHHLGPDRLTHSLRIYASLKSTHLGLSFAADSMGLSSFSSKQ